jgi:translation initiation factor 1
MSKLQKKIIHQEFGNSDHPETLERETQDLPPQQQNLIIQATRKGRKGKTVTIISGFQTKPEKLHQLLKHLKTQCGSGGTIKDDTLELQGSHAEKLSQILKSQGFKVKISGGS